ncbi:hypothetical protein KEM55_009152 [Ascosphaera atra]|nr:hypothetical protein KEM55_009152 [Ascosphaera atra]
MATEQILTSPTPSPMNTKLRNDIYGRVAGILEHLTGEREELLISAHKLNPSDPGYSQAAARVEQVAYQLGSNLKYLVSRLDPEPEPDHPSDAQAATAGHDVNQQNQLPSSPRRPEAHDSDANEHSDADSVYDEADVYEYGEKAEVASVATPVRARSLYNKGASPPI